MRTPTALRLLLVPAALLAAGCDDDSSSPLEPVRAEAAAPDSAEVPSLLDGPARWADGYLLAVGATTTSPYSPYANDSYNRAGGPITITKVAGTTGRYVARFAGLTALIGSRNTVLVSSQGTDATYCKPASSRLVRDSVEVRCFKSRTGAAANTMFRLLVSGVRADRAFAFAHQPTAADYSPASSGSYNFWGTSRVYRDGVGVYRVVFNGLGGRLSPGVGGHVQVTAVGPGKAHCEVGAWGGSPNMAVRVHCFTPAGAPVDAKFTTLFALPAAHLAYALADRLGLTSYNPSSVYGSNPVGGAIRIERSATGFYEITWTGVIAEIVDRGSAQVTAYGGDGTQCKLRGVGDEFAVVQCYAGDVPADSYFTVMLHS
jgi:hypothetical protein